ncbi:methionine synthase reductase, partial [Brachionus plicatilis]
MVGTSKKIAIIYATQTGQAKTIAETINDEAITNGFEPVLYDISQFSRKRLLNEITDPAVFVCSTTGDGEVPESALRCYNSLKRLEAESNQDFFKNFNYALLGLGDTNYTQFCNGAKLFNQKFQQLGAHCFYGPSWADDGTGLDVEVEPFIEGLWDALDKFFRNAKKHTNQTVQINTDQLSNELNKLSIVNPDLSGQLSVPEYVENHLKI